jgi:hypothetical protein
MPSFKYYLFLTAYIFISSYSLDASATPQGDKETLIRIPIDGRLYDTYVAMEDYWFFVEDVCNALLISPCDIYVRNGAINNAVFLKYDGNDTIIYDRRLSEKIGLEGAIAVIAHEIGHYHCRKIGMESANPHERELQADAIAGAAIRRMGLLSEEGINKDNGGPYHAILSKKSSATHPASKFRSNAFRWGYANPDLAKSCKLQLSKIML